ncbi:hypothetical protein CHARACLAT_031897 [Characodon lateralis]|uniref:Uncharacterized protein n=1 Tax=Characodon lateralis TaxID=208331 RepID=A0ABU7EPC6_9TELE|nr:hypothetical protein [Characodon lateralis]
MPYWLICCGTMSSGSSRLCKGSNYLFVLRMFFISECRFAVILISEFILSIHLSVCSSNRLLIRPSIHARFSSPLLVQSSLCSVISGVVHGIYLQHPSVRRLTDT